MSAWQYINASKSEALHLKFAQCHMSNVSNFLKQEGRQGHGITSNGTCLGDYLKKMLRNTWKCVSEA